MYRSVAQGRASEHRPSDLRDAAQRRYGDRARVLRLGPEAPMTKPSISAALAVAFGVALSAQNPLTPAAPQVGPDLSGRWNRESVSGDAGGSSIWGSRVEIGRSGNLVTVRSDSNRPEQYRPDGTETAEVLTVDGCANKARITKYQASKDRVTITTWLVIKSGCFHGEDEDDPRIKQTGVVEVREVPGSRRLESITDVYRDGDVMRVDTTRTASTVGGKTTSTTTTYRK